MVQTFVVLIVLSLSPPDALSAPVSGSSDRPIRRDAGTSEVPDRTPESDAVFDTLFANRGERVTEVVFISGFAPGASRDISPNQLARIRPGGYLIGATDPERFDGRRNSRNLSQLHNYSLGVARANWVNAKTGYRAIVLPEVVLNDRRGVYQVFTAPRKADESRPKVQPVVIPYNDIANDLRLRQIEQRPFWFRPSAGASLLTMDPDGFITPMISGSAGLRLGSTDVGVYAMEGQDFQPMQRGLCRYGLQLGDELGWAFRTGYQSDWTELRGDGHTDRRREGGEIGVAYGTSAFSVSGYLGLGWYADRRDRDGRAEPSLGLTFTLGPVFRTNN